MKCRMAAVAAALAMAGATVATAAPAFAGASGSSAVHTGKVAQRACTYDVCMYTKKNFKGTWKGYNHYENKCVNYSHAFKIRSFKIHSSTGTTFWSKKGCSKGKGKPSMSFKGHVKVKNYKFTARSSR